MPATPEQDAAEGADGEAEKKVEKGTAAAAAPLPIGLAPTVSAAAAAGGASPARTPRFADAPPASPAQPADAKKTKAKPGGKSFKKGKRKAERRDALDPLSFMAKSFQKTCTAPQVDKVVQQVSDNLKRLDKEISIQVQNSKSLGNHIGETKDLIHKSVASVTELRKESAQAVEQSSLTVGRARFASTNHMAQALDGLTSLKEMRSSINQAKQLRDNAQYAGIAPHLKKQLALKPYFTRYSGIPVVEKLLAEVEAFQEKLLDEILAEFKQSYGKVEDDLDLASRLADSASLMDAMGESGVHDLRKWFVANKQEELEYFAVIMGGDTLDSLPPVKTEETEAAIKEAEKALFALEDIGPDGEPAGDEEAIGAANAVLQEKRSDALEAGLEAAKIAAYDHSQPKSLDDLCERYQWLEDQLDEYTYTYMDIFPMSWEVSEAFTHKCCMYLRSFVEGVLANTKPTIPELQDFLERTHEFEEFLADRYAAAAAAVAAAGGSDLASRTASSVGRTRSRSGSIRRTGSVVGRGGYQINWNGIISREVNRLVVDLLPQGEESGELGRPAGSEGAGTAGGSVLVPRMPRQSADGNSVARAAAEPWDFRGDSQRFKTAAFESLLLCMSGSAFDELEGDADAMEATVTGIMRVQMGLSRRAFVKLQSTLRLPDQVKDVDLAAVLGAAELQGVELEPFLHFRFLLLETHQPQDFDSDEEFVDWFDRQVNVFLSGLFWKLETIAELNPEKRSVQLANLDSFSIRDAYYEIQSTLDSLKENLLREDDNTEEFIEITKELEDDLECLYGQIDEAMAESGGGGDDDAMDTNQGTNHVLPLAFPLNVELYTTALLTIFDQEESMWGELKEEAEELLVVFKFWRPFLNISDVMHQIAMVRCYFIVYMQCINAGEETERAPDALIAFEGAVAELAKISATVTPTDESTRYELAVKMDILKTLETRLLNYHQSFEEEDMSSVRGEFDVYVAMKAGMAGLTRKAQQKVCEGEAVRFIRSSANKFYSRLSKAVDQETALGAVGGADDANPMDEDEDDGPVAGMRDLADYLAEEGLLKVVMVAKLFKAYHKKAGTAAVMALTAEYQKDIDARLAPFTEVTEDVANLLNATRNLLNTLTELYGDKAQVKFAHIMMPFQRLVKRELEMQHMKFDGLVEQAMITDHWESINEMGLSASSVDIFTMLGQSLPMVMESGLLLIEENVNTLVQNVDGMIMKYAMHVLRSCGERAPIQKKKEKKSEKMSSNVDSLRDKAAAKAASRRDRKKDQAPVGTVVDRGGTAVDDQGEGGEGAEGEEAAEIKANLPSYAVITTEELCVRVNSLVHCTRNIKTIASRIAYELASDDWVDPLCEEFDPSDRKAADKVPLAGSIMVLESCTEQLIAFIGAKLVFHDIENELLLGLYVPTPERGMRIDGTLMELDEVMEVLFDTLPDADTFKMVLGGIFTCFVEVVSKVLTEGGTGRKYKDEDATIFVEDLESMESWFIARDEAGDAQGLAVDLVEEKTLPLHELVGQMRFAAGKG